MSVELHVMRRPRRRTHLLLTDATRPMCGTRTPIADIRPVGISLTGGASTALKNELLIALDSNACIPCQRIALGMLALYAVRRTGGAR